MDDLRTWGRVDAAELARLVVVSPHFDDAVLGASNLLAGSPDPVVVTVFGGAPVPMPDPCTEWDSLGGFVPGDDVIAMRRDEDRRGLAELGATPVWLDHVDQQYRSAEARARVELVADDLGKALRGLAPTAVAIPFGLANDDHVDAHDAALMVRDRWLAEGHGGGSDRDTPAWFCFEDTGYKHIPGLLAWRIAGLFRSGLWPSPCAPPVGQDPSRRRRAFAHYASQVRALGAEWAVGDLLDAPAPEQLWRLAPPPAGWEALIDL